MRVYLPTTLTALACLLRTGAIGPAPVRGFAVTPALREWYASGDLEELEYVAMAHAARASLRLLADDPQAPRRRVVLAADVPDEQVGHDGGFDQPTLVEVRAPVTVDQVVSAPCRRPARGGRHRRGGGRAPSRRQGRRRRAVCRGRGRGARTALVRLPGAGLPDVDA